ncbi:EFR1 family ferrodoxin [Treponema sp. TIM-1]|uniref:EFR1 family ferrodoxin n=1 Tax=Treponema sp. TIM-1 TaxID=2898417 RepID=UPI003980153B
MTKLFYFSGTGNTLWSAKKIAEILDGQLFNIGVEMRKPAETIEADRVILLFPAYAYQSPLLVRCFLDRSEFRSPYMAALTTFGSDPGGALAEVYRIFKRKKTPASYFAAIPSVENYIPIFGPQPEKTKQRRLALQEKATEKIAQDILQRKTNSVWPLRPLSMGISSLFKLSKSFFVKGFKVSAVCNGCGVCARICPAANIVIEKGKPVFLRRCEQCQACLNWCPRRAIGYLRFEPDTCQYHHPQVSVSEMYCSL